MNDRQPSADPAVPASDRELLTRFVAKRDEAAFRLIVGRHSALVWSVCRHMLRSQQDQEDVFQATFLKLVIQANRQPWQQTIGGWLHKVAYRLSLNLRALQKRRQEAEFPYEPWLKEDALDAIQRHDLELALHRALSRLTARNRETLVLYYFQNKSQEETAAAMQCSVDAINGILKRSRRKLLLHFGRRGLSLSLAIVAVEGTLQAAPRLLNPQLIENTVFVSSCRLAGNEGIISPPVKTLSQGKLTTVLNSSSAVKSLIAGSCSVMLCLGGAGLFRNIHDCDTAHAASLLMVNQGPHVLTNPILLVHRWLPETNERPLEDFSPLPTPLEQTARSAFASKPHHFGSKILRTASKHSHGGENGRRTCVSYVCEQ